MLLKICCLKVSVPDNRIKCFDDLKHVSALVKLGIIFWDFDLRKKNYN